MKKFITLIAMLAIAGTVSAGIVNGDFTGSEVAANNTVDYDDLNDGWSHNAWVHDSGAGTITCNSGNNYTSFGQLFESTDTGSKTLKVTWMQDTTVAAKEIFIEMWGFSGANDGTFEQNLGKTFDGDGYFIKTATSAAGTVTSLGRTHLNRSGDTSWVTTEIDITMDSGTYDYYGIRIAGRKNSNMVVSDVSVPEPATVGMLGLGALVALLVRRIRA